MENKTRNGQMAWSSRLRLTNVALAVSIAIASPAEAATITVDAACLFRNAIIAANTDAPSGSCPAGSGADTINMPAGAIGFSSSEPGVDILGNSATPVISSQITLQGNDNSTIFRSLDPGTPDFRLLTVVENGALTIDEVNILYGATTSGGGILCSSGTLTINNSRIDFNSSSLNGGAIAADNCPLTITGGSELRDNSAGAGGAIRAIDSPVQISDTRFFSNEAEQNSGGALEIRQAPSSAITNSEFTANTADDDGGAISLRNSVVTVLGGSMSNNRAHDGGAISVRSSTLNLTNSQLSQNSVTNMGRGGALYGLVGSVTVSGAVVESNRASSGGGFLLNNSTLNTSNTRFENNFADSAGAVRSINSSFSFTGNSVLNNYAVVLAGGLSLSNGARPTRLESNIINSNSAGGYAGGMLIANSSNVLMNQDQVTNNSANRIGGVEITTTSTVTLSNATIRGNLAATEIGGLQVDNSQVNIERSSLSANSAARAGGVQIINTSTVSLRDTSVQGNTVTNTAGGLDIESSDVTIERSTVSDNRADASAGITAVGGSVLSIQNSTISQNSASFATGGIQLTNSSLSLNHATVFQNGGGNYASGIYRGGPSSSVFLVNSIIAFNGVSDCNTSADTIFQGNWFGDNTCSGDANGDPLLGPLQDNGGPTETHALLAGSGAIDIAITGFCQFPVGLIDQRGLRRTGVCDSGAFEYGVSETNFYVIPLPNGRTVVIPL